jgi:hypothetical protein
MLLNQLTWHNMFGMKIKPGARNKKVFMQIDGLKNATTRAIRYGMKTVGAMLVRDTVAVINEQPKHGRSYMVKVGRGGRELKSGRLHVASAPGEAPAVITGTLRKSINFTVIGSDKMKFGVDLDRGNADYGKWLEYKNIVSMSGKGSKNIAPRPFISASYKKNKDYIPTIFKNCLAKEYK